VASVHSSLHSLAAPFFFICFLWTTQVLEKNGFPQVMFSCSAREGLPQDCAWKESGINAWWSFWPTPFRALRTTCAKRTPLGAVGRLPTSMQQGGHAPRASCRGTTQPGEDYRRRARKGLPGAT
jgi:hypothetical protein